MSPSTISIRPSTEPEVPSLIRLAEAAFGHNAIASALFPESREPDPAKRWDAEFEFRSQRVAVGLKNPQRRYITAVEGAENADGGTVVGWAAWEIKNEGPKEENKSPLDGVTFPPAADVEAIKSFGEHMDAAEEKTMERLGRDSSKPVWSE